MLFPEDIYGGVNDQLDSVAVELFRPGNEFGKSCEFEGKWCLKPPFQLAFRFKMLMAIAGSVGIGSCQNLSVGLS